MSQSLIFLEWNLRYNPGAHINSISCLGLKEGVIEEWMVQSEGNRGSGLEISNCCWQVTPSVIACFTLSSGPLPYRGWYGGSQEEQEGGVEHNSHGHEAELQNKTNQKDLKMSDVESVFTQSEAMLTALQVKVFSLVWDSTLVFWEWWLGGECAWMEECCKQEVHGGGPGESLVSKSPMSNKGSFTKPRSLTSFTRPTHNCERLMADLEDMKRWWVLQIITTIYLLTFLSCFP